MFFFLVLFKNRPQKTNQTYVLNKSLLQIAVRLLLCLLAFLVRSFLSWSYDRGIGGHEQVSAEFPDSGEGPYGTALLCLDGTFLFRLLVVFLGFATVTN